MTNISGENWKSITGIVSELKRCDESGITTASVVMAFICIDALANLSRPANKKKVTQADFIAWVDTYLRAHPDQPYQYRGKDVYAARCALLHTYGSEAEVHEKDHNIIKFGYHDGGKHQHNPSVERGLAIIGTKSFVNDVVHAVESFLKKCLEDTSLKNLVESRLEKVLQTIPYPYREVST